MRALTNNELASKCLGQQRQERGRVSHRRRDRLRHRPHSAWLLVLPALLSLRIWYVTSVRKVSSLKLRWSSVSWLLSLA